MCTTIVVGAGPSETARGAVAAAIDLASTHDASLHIVFAVTGDAGPNRTATGGYVDTDHRANPLLAELAAEAESSGVTTKLHARSEAPAAASSAAAMTMRPWPMVRERVSTTRTGTALKVSAAVTAEA